MRKLLIACLSFVFALSFLSSPMLAQKGGSTAAKTSGQSAAAKPAAPLDINSATQEELEKLPGIGKAYSEKIIKGRPYTKKDQLVSRNILPQATYDKIKDMIVARQKK
jgi:competence protein ComEA